MDAANYSEEFMTSFVFGDDAISKISINSIEELRRDLIDIMYKCTTPKVYDSSLLRSVYIFKICQNCGFSISY